MVTQELLDFIRQRLASNISRLELTKTLQIQGYTAEEITEAFATLDAPAPVAPTSNQTDDAKVVQSLNTSQTTPPFAIERPVADAQIARASSLPGFWSLLKEAWNIYTDRLGTFFALALIIASPQLIIILLGFVQKLYGFAVLSVLPPFLFSIIYIIISIVGPLWGTVALLFAIKDRAERIGVEEAYKRSQDKVVSWVWIYTLTSVIVGFGFLLLIIPGILFSIWYSLAAAVLVAEGDRGMAALRKSKEYIRGRFDEYFDRLLWFGVLILPFFLINFYAKIVPGSLSTILQQVGGLVLSVLTPVFFIFQFVLYEQLKSLHDSGVLPVKVKRGWMSRVIWLVLIILVVIVLLGVIVVPVVLSSLNTARTKGRDSGREADIQLLSNSLELYSIEKNSFPKSLDDLVSGGQISTVPIDPATREPYQYTVTSDQSSYRLCATLDNASSTNSNESLSVVATGEIIGGMYCMKDSLLTATGAPSMTPGNEGTSSPNQISLTSETQTKGDSALGTQTNKVSNYQDTIFDIVDKFGNPTGFSKDSKHVYCMDVYVNSHAVGYIRPSAPSILEGADSQTFTAILNPDSGRGTPLGKDSKHVYVMDSNKCELISSQASGIPDMDPNTTVILSPTFNNFYAKDNEYIYHWSGFFIDPVYGADVATFTTKVYSPNGNFDAQDKNYKYLNGRAIK